MVSSFVLTTWALLFVPVPFDGSRIELALKRGIQSFENRNFSAHVEIVRPAFQNRPQKDVRHYRFVKSGPASYFSHQQIGEPHVVSCQNGSIWFQASDVQGLWMLRDCKRTSTPTEFEVFAELALRPLDSILKVPLATLIEKKEYEIREYRLNFPVRLLHGIKRDRDDPAKRDSFTAVVVHSSDSSMAYIRDCRTEGWDTSQRRRTNVHIDAEFASDQIRIRSVAEDHAWHDASTHSPEKNSAPPLIQAHLTTRYVEGEAFDPIIFSPEYYGFNSNDLEERAQLEAKRQAASSSETFSWIVLLPLLVGLLMGWWYLRKSRAE